MGYFNPRSPHGERRFVHGGTALPENDFNPRSPHGERRDASTTSISGCYFNPRSPHGERHRCFTFCNSKVISIHAPRTGSDGRSDAKSCTKGNISIHAPRTGSDIGYRRSQVIVTPFQSTLPARGATTGGSNLRLHRFISIHAPRTGSDMQAIFRAQFGDISIHAPRTGSDMSTKKRFSKRSYFNPRSPHGERHRTPQQTRKARDIFQSTLPARGATHKPSKSICLQNDFNPRSPHGERRFYPSAHHLWWSISIHAPRTGSDLDCQAFVEYCLQFQSTLPARGATSTGTPNPDFPRDFNPRSPHGERQIHCIHIVPQPAISIHAPRTGSDHQVRRFRQHQVFQSTLPARGATPNLYIYLPPSIISIHAPRTGSDTHQVRRFRQHQVFQSTLPARGATDRWQMYHNCQAFQSTLPARGATNDFVTFLCAYANFNPRSPHGERLGISGASVTQLEFQSTLPARGATG